jgi:molecular chaperone DnaJ
MFKKISEAYAVLSNPDRRKKYDLWGQTSQDNDEDAFFSEFFDDMFGGDMTFGFGGLDDMEEFIKILEGDNVK